MLTLVLSASPLVHVQTHSLSAAAQPYQSEALLKPVRPIH